MEEAGKGDTVTIHYTGRLGDGTVFDSSEGRDPLTFRLGEGKIIPGLESAVEGMQPGESRTAEVPSGDAYGPHRDDLLIEVGREQLPEEMDPGLGDRLEMRTPDGQVVRVRVAGVEGERVVLDANHPLAGKDLVFDIELVEIG